MARGWGWWGTESPEAAFIYEDGREGMMEIPAEWNDAMQTGHSHPTLFL